MELPVKPEQITGTYIGDFKGSPIAITLNYVGNGHASGYNVHRGLKRNISGTMEFTNGKLHADLSEPGNNPYDGKFNLTIDTTKWTGKGNWKPLKKGDEVNFTFQKRKNTGGEEMDPFSSIYMNDNENYIQLYTDGSCIYSYLTDTTKTAQSISIRGNYTMNKDSVVSVYWQKNDIFPSRQSTFKMKTEHPDDESDYAVKVLKGEGKKFTQMMY